VARLVRVAGASEIPVGQGRMVEVAGREVALFNVGNGTWCAVDGTCPHEGGPLGEGLLHRGAVVCPWHGFDFDPATGACRADPALSVAVHPARREGGDVVIELPE
jgi:nitrite reductase (NADH) small subunit